MHKMLTIATSVPVAWCVNLSVTLLRPAKTAERIDVLVEVETVGDPRNIVLNGGPDLPTGRGFDAAFAKTLWLQASMTVHL